MRLLGLVVCGPLLACAAGGDGDEGGLVAEQALTADEAALSSALLSYANGATASELDGVVSKSAAGAIVAARPFTRVAALAATANVGNSTLHALLRAAAPDDVAAGAGFWEKTLVSADQAATMLEMANGLELTTFGCDLGLASAGQRIMAARPLATMDALGGVAYVGTSQLVKLKKNVAWFKSGNATAARFDCVSFTEDEIDAGLDFVNSAGFGQLCAVGGCGFSSWAAKVPLLIAGRPWTSLDALAKTAGIGPASMNIVRHGARDVLDGMTLGSDSVRRVLDGEVHAEWVELGATQTLQAYVAVPRTYVPGTGYVIRDCRRIADAGDPDPQANSALECTGGCSPNVRYWFDAQLGLVFYSGTCQFD